MSRAQRGTAVDGGYAMVALLVGLSIMAIALSVALPTWSTLAKREREEELIFRGQQYARAIALYQRRYANAFPPTIDQLVDQKFLRKKYKDPMTRDGEFQPILVGQPIPGQTSAVDQTAGRDRQAVVDELTQRTQQRQQAGRGRAGQPPQQLPGRAGAAVGGIVGVVSKSDATAMRLFNGRDKYNEWAFVATPATTAAGAPTGGQTPVDNPPRRGGPGAGPLQGPPGGRRGRL